MVHESVVACIGRTPLVYLRRLFPQPGPDVIAKLEFLNPGGSVKDRPARFIVEEGLRCGTIHAETHLIESSSGNLGIALAMVAQRYRLAFTCVVDPAISPTNLRILQLLGAQIEMVEQPDDQGGYLKTRIQRVQELLRVLPESIWINQYANQLNWQAHYYGTGDEILSDLDGPIDCLVTAVSTTGTLLGLARRLRQAFPRLHVIAVDATGSVIFGGPAGPRKIPGIGASRLPELLSLEEIDDVVYISDREAVTGCRALVTHEGIFAGGSSGSVIAALTKLRPSFPKSYRVLTILPDRGERYLDMVYDDAWTAQLPQVEDVPMRALHASARPSAAASEAVEPHRTGRRERAPLHPTTSSFQHARACWLYHEEETP
ncbi:MAG TPA: 2,3-diaminopropionate biosynthesis protein SbnA [Herpetosiphonaceae bacterium]